MHKTIRRDEAGKIVRNPDGSSRVHYDFSDEPGPITVVMTGPISGIVAAADGTEYDVTDDYIKVDPAHADSVRDAILTEHHAQGRFLDVPVPAPAPAPAPLAPAPAPAPLVTPPIPE